MPSSTVSFLHSCLPQRRLRTQKPCLLPVGSQDHVPVPHAPVGHDAVLDVGVAPCEVLDALAVPAAERQGGAVLGVGEGPCQPQLARLLRRLDVVLVGLAVLVAQLLVEDAAQLCRSSPERLCVPPSG